MWLFLAIECRRGKPPYPVVLLDEVPVGAGVGSGWVGHRKIISPVAVVKHGRAENVSLSQVTTLDH